MNEPAPRKRFRFSLRFLIAWVMLTAILFGLSFKITTEVPSDPPWPGFVDTREHFQGWPFSAYVYVRKSQLSPDAIYIESKLQWGGVLGNLAVSMVTSMVLCALARTFLRSASIPPMVNDERR